MTKYRTVSNGYWEYLQYEHEYRFLYFWKKREWRYVWWPYYDKVTGRYYVDCPSDRGYVNSLRGITPKKFVEKYPDINEYFKWATEEQEKLVNESKEYWKEINERKTKIKYL